MARRAEGYKCKPKPDSGIYHVRFTWPQGGHRYDISTGTRDATEAGRLAPTIYADVVNGKTTRTEYGELANSETLIKVLTAKWLVNIHPELRGKTPETYMCYARKWVKTFETLGGISSSAIGDYQRARLGKVQKSTVVKERSGLLRFLKWLKEKKYVTSIPEFPEIPRKALGTKYAKAKRRSVPQLALTPEWTNVFLNALPVKSERKGFFVRPRFRFQFATALRPTFIDAVKYGDVRPDGKLRITAWLDKNGNARLVPLTQLALEVLEEIGTGPRDQLIFGKHDYREYVDEAKKLLPPHLREEFTPYGLKHSRVTQLIRAGESEVGIQFLTGTKYALGRYALPSEEAAADIATRF